MEELDAVQAPRKAGSDGEVRWMEVRDWLKHASDNGRKPVRQVVFEGERFDVMSVRRAGEGAESTALPPGAAPLATECRPCGALG